MPGSLVPGPYSAQSLLPAHPLCDSGLEPTHLLPHVLPHALLTPRAHSDPKPPHHPLLPSALENPAGVPKVHASGWLAEHLVCLPLPFEEAHAPNAKMLLEIEDKGSGGH